MCSETPASHLSCVLEPLLFQDDVISSVIMGVCSVHAGTGWWHRQAVGGSGEGDRDEICFLLPSFLSDEPSGRIQYLMEAVGLLTPSKSDRMIEKNRRDVDSLSL
jgi:hypothetical protein